MPMSLEVDAEGWKYSNVNAALKKLDISTSQAVWEMTGIYAYLQAEAEPNTVSVLIPKNTKIENLVEFKLDGMDEAHHVTHVKLTLEEGAELVLFERQKGWGSYWKNITFDIHLGENARLTHYRLCEEDPFCVATEFVNVFQQRGSRYQAVILNGSSGFSRAEFQVKLLGAGAEADLSGLTFLNGRQHADVTVNVEHVAPHCRSSQFFKTVLDGQARGVYQGKIHVHKDAQKTDGYQLSKNILLSRTAEMDVKPELEIYADDVKCSHGTTTGALDETPMFYLRSRGLTEEDARRLLLEAFMLDILDKIPHEEMREMFEGRVKLWLK